MLRGLQMVSFLFVLPACQTFEYSYSCDEELVEELTDAEEVSPSLGISVSDAAAWLTRDVETTFESELFDEPVQAGLVVSFEPSGPHRVLRLVGDQGPMCDEVPFLRSEGTAAITIEGYAEYAGPARLVTLGDSSALELGDPLATVVDEAVDSAFLDGREPCSQVDYFLGAGSHQAGLSFSSECEVGTEGGYILRAELQPAEALE